MSRNTRTGNKLLPRLKELIKDNPWAHKGESHQQGFIGYDAMQFFETKVESGATIVELGSGKSTYLLVKMGYKVYTVENKEEYLNKVPGATYIYAPLVGYQNETIDRECVWYDPTILRSELPAEYAALIIDGPEHRQMGRYGACYYHKMFLPDRPLLIDDLQVPFVYMMALNLAQLRGATNIDIHLTGRKTWGWVS